MWYTSVKGVVGGTQNGFVAKRSVSGLNLNCSVMFGYPIRDITANKINCYAHCKLSVPSVRHSVQRSRWTAKLIALVKNHKRLRKKWLHTRTFDCF